MATIKYNNIDQTIAVNLFLVRYKDENEVYYVYSPELDLHGYGNSEDEAMQHFYFAVQDFIEYTHENGTLDKVLKKLGWMKRSKPELIVKKVLRSKEMANIFTSYETHSSFKEINMPTEFAY